MESATAKHGQFCRNHFMASHLTCVQYHLVDKLPLRSEAQFLLMTYAFSINFSSIFGSNNFGEIHKNDITF